MTLFCRRYSVDWYDLTPRAQKLLILIMVRSQRPCQITAGKIYAMTMENYSAVRNKKLFIFNISNTWKLLSLRAFFCVQRSCRRRCPFLRSYHRCVEHYFTDEYTHRSQLIVMEKNGMSLTGNKHLSSYLIVKMYPSME